MSDIPRRPSRIAWLAPVAVNIPFGYLAVLPFGFVWYFLAQYPLAALGLTDRDPTDNDGVLPHLVLLTVTGLFLALWTAVNAMVRRRVVLPVRLYWTVAAALLLGPFVLIGVFPTGWEMWQASWGWL
ncbi:hypothetical protein [Sphaerisporangium aureirubrum]|uniref:Uncharacterized protein n=1 Tax=Sphaerisporangium aureirubrum TaxID=1544736 RepID=A0ABW1NTI8_9ACTN